MSNLSSLSLIGRHPALRPADSSRQRTAADLKRVRCILHLCDSLAYLMLLAEVEHAGLLAPHL